jgi:hypothetical protein
LDLGAAGFSLGVRSTSAVAASSPILAEMADMAELVATGAPADSKVSGVGFAVKDLGLPEKAALA